MVDCLLCCRRRRCEHHHRHHQQHTTFTQAPVGNENVSRRALPKFAWHPNLSFSFPSSQSVSFVLSKRQHQPQHSRRHVALVKNCQVVSELILRPALRRWWRWCSEDALTNALLLVLAPPLVPVQTNSKQLQALRLNWQGKHVSGALRLADK